ncbi:MAG: hypothetical protein V7603_6389 [Micromonosporaceae bacterium]
MEFAVVDAAPPIGGQLRYDQRGLSFDFRPADPDMARRGGQAVELAFGSMALQVDRDSAELLGAWGYHPDAGWLSGSLGSPNAVAGRLKAHLPEVPPRGVSPRLVRAGDLTTIRDSRTGWIRVGRTGVPTGTRFVEFATGCLAELAGGDLVALWLRPTTPAPAPPPPEPPAGTR